MQPKRNYLLNFAKGLASINVIFGHFKFPGSVGESIHNTGEAGVIIFLLIGGYYSYNKNGNMYPVLIKRFKRNLTMTLKLILYHFIYTFCEKILLNKFDEWISNYKRISIYFRMLILGDFKLIYGYHFWYLVGLLYTYLIFCIIDKYKLYNALHRSIYFLIFLRIGVDVLLKSVDIKDWHIKCNFLVSSLPSFTLGHLLASKKEYKIKNSILLILIFISIIMVIICTNVKILGMELSPVFYMSSGVFSFIYCIKNPEKSINKLIEFIGEELSLNNFNYHMIVGFFLFRVTNVFITNKFFIQWIFPPISVIFICSFSYILYYMRKRSKIHNKLKGA